ncbi:hypothetical protein GCM10020331_039350 [Ectobacillus funiculus]
MLLNGDRAKKRKLQQKIDRSSKIKIDDAEVYKRQLARITDAELQELPPAQLEVFSY